MTKTKNKHNESWVIRDKATGKVLFETFNPKIVAALNTAKYEAVPILEYLVDLNRTTKGQDHERRNQRDRTHSGL